jgi:hypothetical protein
MTHVESQGRHYSEHVDFVAELREAIADGRGAPWLRYDVPDLYAALHEWASPIVSSDLGPRFVDAVLTFIETAPVELARYAAGLPWESAPNAVERAATVLEREPARFGDARGIAGALWTLFAKAPANERLRALLRRELARPEPDELARSIARRYPDAAT